MPSTETPFRIPSALLANFKSGSGGDNTTVTIVNRLSSDVIVVEVAGSSDQGRTLPQQKIAAGKNEPFQTKLGRVFTVSTPFMKGTYLPRGVASTLILEPFWFPPLDSLSIEKAEITTVQNALSCVRFINNLNDDVEVFRIVAGNDVAPADHNLAPGEIKEIKYPIGTTYKIVTTSDPQITRHYLSRVGEWYSILNNEISLQTGAIYTIRNNFTETYLGVSSNGSVVGYSSNGEDEQKWIVESAPNGMWTLQSKARSEYLGISASGASIASPLVTTSESVQWIIAPAIDLNLFRLLVFGKYPLTPQLNDRSRDDEPVTLQRSLLGRTRQMWEFNQVGKSKLQDGKAYLLGTDQMAHSYIEAWRGGVGAHTSLLTNNNVHWVLESTGNGNWALRNRNTNLYLGVGQFISGWPSGFHAPIILVSQRVEWAIRPAYSEENGTYNIFVPGTGLRVSANGDKYDKADPISGSTTDSWYYPLFLTNGSHYFQWQFF